MSFTSEIQRFCKAGLRPTSTAITRLDGTKWVETKCGDQNAYSICRSSIDTDNSGYVVDLLPDMQIGWILPDLLLGSVDVAREHSLLMEHKVTHILNVASFNTQFAIECGLGDSLNNTFSYKNIGIKDVPDTNIVSYFDECFAFIDSAFENSGRVLVHCMAGVSRSASIVIAYLIKTRSMDFETAFNHVKAKRPSIRPNDGFMDQLRLYGQHVQHQEDSSS